MKGEAENLEKRVGATFIINKAFMQHKAKRLESLAQFEVLNLTEMNVIAGGLVAEPTTGSDKKDVDSTEKDSYRDDKSDAGLTPDF